MSHDRQRDQQWIVDRAVESLRATATPAPPEDVLRAVISAGESGPPIRDQRTPIQRIFTMKRIATIAAAVIIVAGAIGLILVLGDRSATIAWADVQEKIRNARTVSMRITMQQEGAPDIVVTRKIMEGGLMRQEISVEGEPVTQIYRLREGKLLVLVHKSKTAVHMGLSGMPEKVRRAIEKGDTLASMKELIEEAETELGEKEIAGRPAKGYRVTKGGMTFSIWADAKTGDPVKVTLTVYQGEVLVTMSDFRFNEEMDESLFSLDKPEGYKWISEKPVDIGTASAEDFVEFFKLWAECREGTFPPTLSENQWMKDCLDHVKKLEKELSDAEVLTKLLPHSRARLFLQMRPHLYKNYLGKDVELGAKDTAIFWYKPKDAETFTVIYGDLRIDKDVAKEDLPEAPEDEEKEGDAEPAAEEDDAEEKEAA